MKKKEKIDTFIIQYICFILNFIWRCILLYSVFCFCINIAYSILFIKWYCIYWIFYFIYVRRDVFVCISMCWSHLLWIQLLCTAQVSGFNLYIFLPSLLFIREDIHPCWSMFQISHRFYLLFEQQHIYFEWIERERERASIEIKLRLEWNPTKQ